MKTRLLIALGCCLLVWTKGAGPQLYAQDRELDSTEVQVPATELPRIEPLSPEQELNSFQLAEGYRIELVAAEPLVVDPVAFCFDTEGRLVVAEMRGYSERPDDRAGRVRRLTDTDHDGVMDKVELIVEGLSWPTAVAAVPGGIVVAAAPDLIFVPEAAIPAVAPESDSPVVVDFSAANPTKAQVLARGFGKSNVQGLVNSLRWGLDLRLHGATSSSGAEIVGLQNEAALRLGRRDFAIDWQRRKLVPVDGGGQHGMVIDPWGDKYVCSNSDHLQQVLTLPERSYRVGETLSNFEHRRSIAVDGPQADVFRQSPVEPWRILRTHLRVSGQASGPIEGGGRAAGYFTGATGVYVYDGGQWYAHPESDQRPTYALVCDVGSNLVHRKLLESDGLWKLGQRIDAGTEFVRSSDIWFRPVQLGTGPDGALYIADMYREVIEHPKSLPPLIKNQVDLNSGNDRGRIWRVVADAQPVTRNIVNLSQMPLQALVEAVDTPSMWMRRTAARLLLEHAPEALGSAADLGDALRKIAREGRFAEGRLQALAVLALLQAQQPDRTWLDRQAIRAALADPHPRIRQRAIEWTAGLPDLIQEIEPDVWKAMAADESIYVQFQLAYDAPLLLPDRDERAEFLLQIARQHPASIELKWAIEGSLTDAAWRFVESVAADPDAFGRDFHSWLALASYQGIREAQAGMATIDRLLDEHQDGNVRDALMEAFAASVDQWRPEPEVVAQVRLFEDPNGLSRELETMIAQASTTDSALAARMRIIRFASQIGDRQVATSLIDRWLASDRAPRLQRLVLQYLVSASPGDWNLLTARLPELTPQLQQLALNRLAETRDGLRYLATAIDSAAIPADLVTPEVAERLKRFADYSLPQIARRPVDGFSPELFEAYRKGLDGPVDRAEGKAVFKRLCATCHRVGEVGNQVGPDLKSLVEKSQEQILLSIMDPNREVDPRFRLVQVETIDGRLIAGILQDETADDLLVIDGQGKPQRIQRTDVETLQTRAQSLMPEGLVREITVDQMRSLIGLLKQPEEK